MRFPPHEPTGSGAQSLVGYVIDLTASDGSARVTLDLEPKHMNRNGTLQGGIHAMLLDAGAGFAASRHLAGEAPDIVPVVTLSLNISYLAPAVSGRVVSVGHVTGGGRKIVYAEAVIQSEDGTTLSRAQGVFRRAPG